MAMNKSRILMIFTRKNGDFFQGYLSLPSLPEYISCGFNAAGGELGVGTRGTMTLRPDLSQKDFAGRGHGASSRGCTLEVAIFCTPKTAPK